MRARLRNAVLYSAALAQLTLMAGPAWAQSGGDDEIVVTAQRREQQLQDVPASVVAIGEEELERRNIDELTDYLTTVPGMNYSFAQGPTGARGRQTIGIRGFSRLGGLQSNTVGFYIDETPVDISNPRIFDLDRIEVLRGPQGTLYGAASQAGTIKLITNQPSSEGFAGRTSVEYSQVTDGETGYDINQMLNIPLGESAALRIVGTHRREAGFVDNYSRTGTLVQEDINGGEATDVRAVLSLRASPNLTITPSVYHHELSYDAEPTHVVGTAGGLLPGRATQSWASTASEEEFTLYGLSAHYTMGWGELVSQTSYFEFEGASYEDITSSFAARTDFFPVNVFSVTHQESLIHETRLMSDLEGPLQFVSGVYYEDSKRPFTSSSITPGLNTAMAGWQVFPTTPEGDVYYDVASTRDQTQVALYSEATLSLNPMIDVTAGLRYFRFESDTTDDYSGFLFLTLPPVGPGSSSEDGINPKVSVSVRPNDDIMFFATASRGFRPGNANIPLPSTCNASLIAAGITPPGPNSFDSDTVWNYEGGAKTTWFDGRLTANITAFQMDWEDLQVVVRLPSCRISGYVVNAGEARSRGVEFEFAARPLDDLELTLSGAYLDAQLTSQSVVLAAAEGSKLLDTPEWTVSSSAQYSFALSPEFDAYARIDARYRDGTNLNYAGTLRTDDFTQLDLRFGLTRNNDDREWELAFFVQNLTDEDPSLQRDARAASITTVAPYPVVVYPMGGYTTTSIQPRTFGVSLNLSY